MSQATPQAAPTGTMFSDEEHALIAGWLNALAGFGYGGGLCSLAGELEWLGVILPGSIKGHDWVLFPARPGFQVERAG